LKIPPKPIDKRAKAEAMSSKQARYRKVLAAFIDEIPENKGWWYRLPSNVKSATDGKPIAQSPTETIIPHLGIVFGLTELAMWTILYEMGLIHMNGGRYCVNNNGWLDLKAEFKVSCMEVSPTTLDKKRYQFIKLGFPEHDSPTKIWKQYKKKMIKFPPTTIASRAALKFVAVELLQILKGSNMFLEILQSYTGVNITERQGLDSGLLSTSGRNNRAVTQMLNNSDDETDTTEDNEEEATPESVAAILSASSDITAGAVADPSEFR
jgi:hypothetical protein